MKSFFCIAIISSLIACNTRAKQANDTVKIDSNIVVVKKDSSLNSIDYEPVDSILENRIMDTLLKLSFIQKSNNYIDSFSNHKHGIAFNFDTADGQIFVRAGYNGREDFGLETYYIFYVNPKTLEITVNDPVSDSDFSVDEYIKTKIVK